MRKTLNLTFNLTKFQNLALFVDTRKGAISCKLKLKLRLYENYLWLRGFHKSMENVAIHTLDKSINLVCYLLPGLTFHHGRREMQDIHHSVLMSSYRIL